MNASIYSYKFELFKYEFKNSNPHLIVYLMESLGLKLVECSQGFSLPWEGINYYYIVITLLLLL